MPKRNTAYRALERYRQQVLHARDHAPGRRWNQPGPLINARKQGRNNAMMAHERDGTTTPKGSTASWPPEWFGAITTLHIRHIVGRCPICGNPILDAGYTDDPQLWEHAWN